MSEKPISFKPEMVRAILANHKTMTRRALRPQPVWQEAGDGLPDGWHWEHKGATNFNSKFCGLYGSGMTEEELKDLLAPTQPCAVDDVLYVRERLKRGFNGEVIYVADDAVHPDATWVWKKSALPSIHCPRGLSRIRLRVTAVKVERLQDISEDDAKAEGAYKPRGILEDDGCTYIDGFADIWESINGPGSWDANPWVAAYSFERVT